MSELSKTIHTYQDSVVSLTGSTGVTNIHIFIDEYSIVNQENVNQIPDETLEKERKKFYPDYYEKSGFTYEYTVIGVKDEIEVGTDLYCGPMGVVGTGGPGGVCDADPDGFSLTDVMVFAIYN